MTTKIEELRESELHQELGQKMCAAFIAQQPGITLSTAFKKTEQPVGDLWLLVAEFAIRGFGENAESGFFGILTRAPSKFII